MLKERLEKIFLQPIQALRIQVCAAHMGFQWFLWVLKVGSLFDLV